MLVVGLMLFATSGMALSRMTCLVSGHSVVALGMMEDCCPEPENSDGATLAPICCEIVQAGSESLPFVPSNGLQFTLQATVPLHSAEVVPAQLASEPMLRDLDLTPPITGVEILVKHSVFRI